MKVYGIIGWKNAGKTGLMERLVAEITGRGFSLSTIKHVHHDVDLDQPGKDTFRHRQAGAREVVLASRHRFALMAEHRGDEPELTAILARLAPVDLVLVEGYKRDAHPKVEVFRAETGHPPIQPGDPLVRAVATDMALPALPVPVLDLNDTGAVADFILIEVGLLPGLGFHSVVVVDWSAAATPSPKKPSADAIWVAVATKAGEDATYFRTRHDAEAFLTAFSATETAAGRRTLIGFDFPMGFPKGFAQRLTGQASAKAVHHWLADHITDAPDNTNNRFAVADRINELMGGKGPFWGRPAGMNLPHLPETKLVDYAALGLSERRAVESLLRSTQPVWKCYTTGSVGSQTLMGLPVIHRLAEGGAAVWPFDSPTAPVVLAEIYPSLLAPAVVQESGVKDEAQVRLLARALFRAQGPLLDEMLQVPDIAREEGWILGAGHAAALMALL